MVEAAARMSKVRCSGLRESVPEALNGSIKGELSVHEKTQALAP